MKAQFVTRVLSAILAGAVTVATANAQLAQDPNWLELPKPRAARQPVTAPAAPPPLLAPQLKPLPKPPLRQPRSNSVFWAPQDSNLSTPSAYYLQSMGPHVQLNPAMRYHLSRSSRAPSQLAKSATGPQTTNSMVPGQGAGTFYPGISRAPREKPFSNVERPGGLQEYWPLLLEGRQDPHTGVIIWSLP